MIIYIENDMKFSKYQITVYYFIFDPTKIYISFYSVYYYSV